MPDDQTPKRARRAATSKSSIGRAGRALRRQRRRGQPRRGSDPRASLVDVVPGESEALDAERTAVEDATDNPASDASPDDTGPDEAGSPDAAGDGADADGADADGADADGAAGEQPAEDARATARTRRDRFVQSLTRPGRGQIVAAVILLIFGMGGVMQIRANTADETYSSARREDLIQLLDGLTQESRRLEGEIVELDRTRNQLQSGADTSEVARQEAEKRVSVLSVLAGTVPAHGPGVRMEIKDPQGRVSADLLLDAVEELRDAGAEVIEFDDSVRVVASTWFGNGPNGLMVDGQTIETPIVIEAIGNPHSLEEAARFRGGLVSEITSDKVGGEVEIEQLDDVQITSLHDPAEPQYAQPASAPPTPR